MGELSARSQQPDDGAVTAARALPRTTARMADGRELIFYGETSLADPPADERRLPPIATSSEIRYDPLAEEWVVIASHRQERTHLPSADRCPLCPSSADRPTEIPATSYDVVVFENRFPSLTLDAHPPDTGDGPSRRAGTGRCEVVCYTAEHAGALYRLPDTQLRTVVDVWADRTAVLGDLPGIEHVFPFENRGEEIGVTLHHPHGQIYAYPFVAPRVSRELAANRRYRELTGECLLCRTVLDEADAGERVIAATRDWIAFVPHAARWPFEVHCYARRHLPDLPALAAPERAELVGVLKDVLARLEAVFDRPMPYMAAWHQAPVRIDRDHAHLHLELFSPRRSPEKLKHLAGSESGAGVFVNDVVPERAAQLLRDVRDPAAAQRRSKSLSDAS